MDDAPERDLATLVVPRWGRLVETGDRYEPYRLVDPDGATVEAVAAYFQELLAGGEGAVDGPFLRDGCAPVVAVPAGSGRFLGTSDPGGGQGLQPLDSAGGQATTSEVFGSAVGTSSQRTERRDGEAVSWARLRLRPDTAQRARLADIRDNLIARIAEAEREGWLGEVEGLQVSLAGAQDKLAQLDAEATRRSNTVSLGMPALGQIALGRRETKESSPTAD